MIIWEVIDYGCWWLWIYEFIIIAEVADSKLERAIDLLPVIRQINELHFRHIANMRLSGTSFPDLHDEVFRTKV